MEVEELRIKAQEGDIKFPIKANAKIKNTIIDGILVRDPDRNKIYFLQDTYNGAKSNIDCLMPARYGKLYSWVFDSGADASQISLISSEKQTNSVKITILEFDTFVSVNQNF